jgi:predicted nucleic acid-binding protein
VSAVCIIDTSVFCSLLRVPNKDQHHARAMAELQLYSEAGYILLLPLAAIFETGNHIAQNGSGGQRRNVAELFVRQVRAAVTGEAPWTATPMASPEELAGWLDGFPDDAMRGTSLGDLSIVKVWHRQRELHPGRRVFIWSYDRHLNGYDQPPRI